MGFLDAQMKNIKRFKICRRNLYEAAIIDYGLSKVTFHERENRYTFVKIVNDEMYVL